MLVLVRQVLGRIELDVYRINVATLNWLVKFQAVPLTRAMGNRDLSPIVHSLSCPTPFVIQPLETAA